MQRATPNRRQEELSTPAYEDHLTDENDITCYCMDAINDHYLPGKLVHMHWHNQVEIMLCTQGEALVSIEGKGYALGAGQAAFVQSGELHSGRVSSPGGCVLVSFVLTERFQLFMQSACPAGWPTLRLFDPGISLPTLIEDQAALSHIQNALACAREGDDRAHVKLRLKMALAFEQLAMSQRHAIASAGIQTSIGEMRELINYINRHYTERITLSQLASRFSVSQETIYRLFKRNTGRSPIEFVTHTRLRIACMNLIHTKLPISQVAEACGYEDVNYFARQFRRAYGIPPLKYRMAYSRNYS